MAPEFMVPEFVTVVIHNLDGQEKVRSPFIDSGPQFNDSISPLYICMCYSTSRTRFANGNTKKTNGKQRKSEENEGQPMEKQRKPMENKGKVKKMKKKPMEN